MANELYLSRLRARDFRSLGEVDIKIPAAPGLVVLEGPNGLGKTSFLEALEWVLSGRVHRWQQQDENHGLAMKDHMVRRGASGTTCSVEAAFGEEHMAIGSGGTAPKAATWLCSDPARWSLGPDNLNGFLRGTHFLPQSPSLRLLHLTARDRWNQVLRVVSGYSEIDDLSLALQRVKSPLTTALKEREQRVEQARSARDAWRARVQAAQDRRARAEASDNLLAPTRVAAVLAPDDAAEAPPIDTEDGARTLSADLKGLLASRRSERDKVDARRASLSSLAGVPARWRAAQDAVTLAEATLTTRESEEIDIQKRLEERQSNEQHTTQQLSDAEVVAGGAKHRTEALALLAATIAAIPGSREALVAARGRADSANTRVNEAIARRDELRSRVDQRRTYETRLATHQRNLAAEEAAADAWRRIRELSARRDALVQAGESLKATVADAQLALQAARVLLLDHTAATARARELAENVRTAAGEIEGLVAALARHVDDHTVECPLCLAPYPGVGELRKQVEDTKRRQGPAVVQAEDALRDAVAREAAAAAVVEAAAAAHAQDERRYQDNQAEVASLGREIGELRARMPGITVGHEEEGLEALRAALDAEGIELAVLPGAELESGPVLSMRLEKAETEVGDAETSRTANLAAADLAATSVAQLEAREEGLRKQLDVSMECDVAAQVAEARELQGRADEALRVAQEAWAVARAAREQEEAALSVARTETVSARSARDQRRAEHQDLAQSWASHSLLLPPTSEGLTEAADRLATRLAALDARIASIIVAIEGVGRWLEHAALDREADELDAASNGKGPKAWEEESRRLQERVDAADQVRMRAETLRNDIGMMASSAETKRTSMRSDLQARLSPILTPMLRSLIVDPIIADAVIELAEERKMTRVRAIAGTSDAVDLLALASEGQLSGVNLAVQLSMALAFRWCRWPAVLLDDPAQYSDVVHSTNLVETLRVLAYHHRFQVILATHERDFALYVERKFRNDGLPTTRVMFRQPSDPTKGVVPRIASRSAEIP